MDLKLIIPFVLLLLTEGCLDAFSHHLISLGPFIVAMLSL